MISIVDLLSPECIQLNLTQKRKKRVIFELTVILEAAHKIRDGKALAKKIIERESVSSTGIGHGVAIPHSLTELAGRTAMAFGRSIPGVLFDSVDKKPAQLIFLLTGPLSATGEHLKLLSRLSRLLTEQAFRDSLLNAASPEEVIELFRKNEGL